MFALLNGRARGRLLAACLARAMGRPDPRKMEGAGKTGCWPHPQPGVQEMKAHQQSHYRSNRSDPAFPAQWC